MFVFSRPPHQIMAWVGLERNGYLEEAQRLAYRFLYMYVLRTLHHTFAYQSAFRMTTAFVDFNGVVPEKVCCHNHCVWWDHLILVQFDAVKLSHLVTAEYGNQGLDFKMVPREGFGWMNGNLLFSSVISLTHDSVFQLHTKWVYLSWPCTWDVLWQPVQVLKCFSVLRPTTSRLEALQPPTHSHWPWNHSLWLLPKALSRIPTLLMISTNLRLRSNRCSMLAIIVSHFGSCLQSTCLYLIIFRTLSFTRFCTSMSPYHPNSDIQFYCWYTTF
jgi:hypothetical protein